MRTAQPIRDNEDLARFREYYRTEDPNPRNYLLMVMGLNTALRISDILTLHWGDVYNFSRQKYKEHLAVTEQKTEKDSLIYMNQNLKDALAEYKNFLDSRGKKVKEDIFLFESRKKREGADVRTAISRVQAFRIIRKAAKECRLDGIISCHSLRKTFGYHAWQQGIKPALLMNIYNHSSYQITTRYLGIEQDDRDGIFRDINL